MKARDVLVLFFNGFGWEEHLLTRKEALDYLRKAIFDGGLEPERFKIYRAEELGIDGLTATLVA